MTRIVDTHLHFWDLERFRYPWLDHPIAEHLRWNYVPNDWREDADGLDVVATVHIQAEIDHAVDPVEETAWLASLRADTAGVPVPTVCIGYADLRAPDLDDVLTRHEAYALFRGIRQEAWFDPNSDRPDVPRTNLLDDPAWKRGLERLAAHRLSFDLLVWSHQLEQAAEILRDVPDLVVVLEHTGLPVDAGDEQRELWRKGMRLFAEQVPRAVLKISALGFVSASWWIADIAPVVREALDLFGPHRCMFGSNFPVDRPVISYADLWAAYETFTDDLSSDERAAALCETALTTYRIDVTQSSAAVERTRG